MQQQQGLNYSEEQREAAARRHRSLGASLRVNALIDFVTSMADGTMQPCDALRIALLTRDGAEIRHWLDDGSLVMIRCAKDALRIRALVRSEGLTCSTYAARLDDAQIDKFQDRVGLDYEADAIAAFAEDFARALCIRPRLDACDDDLDLTLDFSGAGVGSASLRLRADGKVSVDGDPNGVYLVGLNVGHLPGGEARVFVGKMPFVVSASELRASLGGSSTVHSACRSPFATTAETKKSMTVRSDGRATRAERAMYTPIHEKFATRCWRYST